MDLAVEGWKIRKARQARGWSQDKLSRELASEYGVEISDSLVSDLERGRASLARSPLYINPIKEFLGINGGERIQASLPEPVPEPLLLSTEGMKSGLEQVKKELDLFNLGVAEVRVKQGMGQTLVDLYSNMGHLGKQLESLLCLVDGMGTRAASLFCQDEPNES